MLCHMTRRVKKQISAKRVTAQKSSVKKVALFRNGRSQAVRIPREFEFEGTEVSIVRQPDGSLLLTPAKKLSLVELLATLSPIADDGAFDFVDVPPEPVEL
jgi:antitoxin VapB